MKDLFSEPSTWVRKWQVLLRHIPSYLCNQSFCLGRNHFSQTGLSQNISIGETGLLNGCTKPKKVSKEHLVANRAKVLAIAFGIDGTAHEWFKGCKYDSRTWSFGPTTKHPMKVEDDMTWFPRLFHEGGWISYTHGISTKMDHLSGVDRFHFKKNTVDGIYGNIYGR